VTVQIIRHVSTMDRGQQPAVRRSDVLRAVNRMGDEFTSSDVAAALNVREYKVRAVMAWLRRAGKIAAAGERKCFSTRQRHGWYMVTTYRLVGEYSLDSFRLLSRAFGC
jgi:transcription initiation factor IIE alpha subunit